MDEWSSEPPDGRIEIELVEHDPGKRRSARAPRPPEAVPPGGSSAPSVAASNTAEGREFAPAPPPRRRTLGIAAGVGAAGLLVGWMAGNAGGDGGLAVAPADSATGATTATSTPASFADDPALVEPDEPVLTTAADRSRLRTTTTTIPRPTIEPLTDVDKRLIGLPYEIVTVDQTGDLAFTDLAAGTRTVIDTDRRVDTDVLLVGHTWVGLPSRGGMGTEVWFDGEAEPEWIEEIDLWSVVHRPGAATFWVSEDMTSIAGSRNLIEVDPLGEPTGDTIAVRGHSVLLDSTGAFVSQAPGGAYAASSTGTVRLTSGVVIGLGATTVLAFECDEQLACGYVAIDRVTSTRRPLPETPSDAGLDVFGYRSSDGGESVSPDGRYAVVSAPSVSTHDGMSVVDGFRPVAIDLADGAVTPLTVAHQPMPIRAHWTADSRFAFFLDAGEVVAFDATTGEVVQAGPDTAPTPWPVAFGLRPTAEPATAVTSGSPVTDVSG